MEKIDSRIDTLKHKARVKELIQLFVDEIQKRAEEHDNSKLETPEVELFDYYTPKLATSTYGTDEYKSFLKGLKPALDNHYAKNSHHPEHYENGVDGMDLFDIVEMFFDWKAAGERHNDGNIFKSIDINKNRFNLSPQLKNIFKNTAIELGF